MEHYFLIILTDYCKQIILTGRLYEAYCWFYNFCLFTDCSYSILFENDSAVSGLNFLLFSYFHRVAPYAVY